MPWFTPTLKDVRILTRDYVLTQLGAKAMIPNSALRIMSDAMAGLSHLVLLYIDWLAKQLLPDTAETEWLDRHGQIWLVNTDGSLGRKSATYASGDALFSGLNGTIIPVGTLLMSASGLEYQTTAVGTIGTDGGIAPLTCLTAGSDGNLPDGESLNMPSQTILPGVDTIVTYGILTGGTDTETDEQLRERILRRIQQPPQGGAAYDYEAWALAVSGVTRAWCAPLEMGMGTVTVRFMMDDLRADNKGFPLVQDIEAVQAYVDYRRPVAVKDCFVAAPLPQPIDFDLIALDPDTPDVRAQIELSVNDMLYEFGAPGQTIYAAWKYNAVMSAPGVRSFNMRNTTDDVMATPGHLATLGDIYYAPA